MIYNELFIFKFVNLNNGFIIKLQKFKFSFIKFIIYIYNK